MNNIKHIYVISQFYSLLLNKRKKEIMFVHIECSSQTPFSITPALIYPTVYSCLDHLKKSFYKSELS